LPVRLELDAAVQNENNTTGWNDLVPDAFCQGFAAMGLALRRRKSSGFP
jgi:hypothetical protein